MAFKATGRRPSIKTPCVADRHHSPDERIAEISFPDGTGCLLALRVLSDGRKVIGVYRADSGIEVTVTAGNSDVIARVTT